MKISDKELNQFMLAQTPYEAERDKDLIQVPYEEPADEIDEDLMEGLEGPHAGYQMEPITNDLILEHELYNNKEFIEALWTGEKEETMKENNIAPIYTEIDKFVELLQEHELDHIERMKQLEYEMVLLRGKLREHFSVIEPEIFAQGYEAGFNEANKSDPSMPANEA